MGIAQANVYAVQTLLNDNYLKLCLSPLKKDLTLQEDVVLSLLINYAHQETGECFPCQATIAKRLGIKQPAVSKIIGKIAEKGFIKVKRTNRSNRYFFEPDPGLARQVGTPGYSIGNNRIFQTELDLDLELKRSNSSSSNAKTWASPSLPEERDQNENSKICAKGDEMHDEDEDLKEIEELNPLSKAYQCRRVTRKPRPNAKPWQSKKVQRREEPAHQVIRKFEDATRNLNIASHTVSKQTILDILAMLKVMGFEKTCEWIDYAVGHWDKMYLAEKNSNARYKLLYYPNLVNLTAHWRYNTWLEGGYEPKEKPKPKSAPLKAKQDAPKVSIPEARFFSPGKK
jgi:hypothetical protein